MTAKDRQFNLTGIADDIYRELHNGESIRYCSPGIKDKYHKAAQRALLTIIGQDESELRQFKVSASCRINIEIHANSRAEALAQANEELETAGCNKVWNLSIKEQEMGE